VIHSLCIEHCIFVKVPVILSLPYVACFNGVNHLCSPQVIPYEILITFLFQMPIDCFEEPWVVFRGKDGKPGCVQNTCAHRACPLHLGSINEGRIQCPYHG
jgi:nitrite reductase/ring-hydroxylating ferredoxin subunit